MTTYRTAGAWGPGKGSDLTPAEVDLNFHEIRQLIDAIGDNVGPEGVGITDITLYGRTVTFHFSDGTTIAREFPVASFFWVDGGWQPNSNMFMMSAFVVDNSDTYSGVYMALRDHTTGASFNPNATLNGLRVYRKLFATADSSSAPYDVAAYHPGPFGSSDDVLFTFVAPRAFVLPINLTTSIARLGVAPSGPAHTFTLAKNGTAFGTVSFATSAINGTFTAAAATSFASADVLTLTGPAMAEDPDAARLAVTLVGALA